MKAKAERLRTMLTRKHIKEPPRWDSINKIILAELPDHLKELYTEAIPYLDGSNGRDELPAKFNEVFQYIKNHMK